MLPLRLEIEHDRRAAATWIVIALNGAVFAWLLTLPEAGLEYAYLRWGFRPDEVSPVTLVTSMFLHGGGLHFAVNMYFLWIFGRGLEQDIPAAAWAAIYAASGIGAGLTHWLFTPALAADIPAVGASGAISGILAAAALRFPREGLLCLFFFPGSTFGGLLNVPAGLGIASWFLAQLLYGAFAGDAMNVAFWAHVGGFVTGAAVTVLIDRIRLRETATPSRTGPLSAEDALDQVRCRVREGADGAVAGILRDYLRGEGGDQREDRLLLEAGRAILRVDSAAGIEVLRALVKDHPDSRHRSAALRLLGDRPAS